MAVTQRTTTGLRIHVDPVACDAYGYCAELLPERITLDEWGYPFVDGTPVTGELVDLARRAAAECPRRAIRFEPVAVDRPRRRSSGTGCRTASPSTAPGYRLG